MSYPARAERLVNRINVKSCFIHINRLISNNSVKHKYIVWMSKIVLFQTIQFRINTEFSSIWPIDRTLSGVTTPSQSRFGSDGNKGVLCVPQNASIIGTSPSDCLVSYPGHSLGGLTSLQRSSRCILQPQPTGQLQISSSPEEKRAPPSNLRRDNWATPTRPNQTTWPVGL